MLLMNGKEIEKMLLKECPDDLKEEVTDYLPYQEAMNVLTEEFLGREQEPRYHFWIREIVSNTSENFPDFNVNFVTAVGSALDMKHGIDGYFLFEHKKTKQRYMVTIDLTVNPEKESHKANLIINPAGSTETGMAPDTVSGIVSNLERELQNQLIKHPIDHSRTVVDFSNRVSSDVGGVILNKPKRPTLTLASKKEAA